MHRAMLLHSRTATWSSCWRCCLRQTSSCYLVSENRTVKKAIMHVPVSHLLHYGKALRALMMILLCPRFSVLELPTLLSGECLMVSTPARVSGE
jgi:hypothetical protein